MLSESKRISILILNYNGRALLDESLSSVIEATRNSKYCSEVIVIDNNSTDDSVKYIKDNFPTVKTSEFKENRYLFSYNDVIKDCQSDYVLLLNNDIKVDKKFIEPLIKKMENKMVFSVMPNIRNWDGIKYELAGNKNKISFKKGWVDWERVEDEKAGVTFFTCAGASIYDRKKFLELGGFDELYFPAYVEDVDLSYGAWKRGWINYYEPDSVVYHKNGFMMKQYFSERKILSLKIRNKYLFFWKNIQARELWQEHIKYILIAVVKSIIKRETTLIQSLCQALKRVKKLRNRRVGRNMHSNGISDKVILQLFR